MEEKNSSSQSELASTARTDAHTARTARTAHTARTAGAPNQAVGVGERDAARAGGGASACLVAGVIGGILLGIIIAWLAK